MSTLHTPQTDTHALHGANMALAPDTDGHLYPPAGQADEQPATRLTTRQSQVLGLLCEGLPDKLIARRLDLSHHTVRGHVQILYGLLHVSNRMQAMFAARQRGLIN
jgi:DNA-binding NarL/FixJ family response regulator